MSLKFARVPNLDDDSSFILMRSEDVEYIDPTEHFKEFFVKHRVLILNELTKREYTNLGVPVNEAISYLTKEVSKQWEETYNEIENAVIPENFLKLLDATSKKEQVKLLKAQQLTSNTLVSFIFRAWKEYNFTFSQYRSENFPKGVDTKSLPDLVYLNDGNVVEKVGKTNHTIGKLKQVLEHRKVIIAKILDKGDDWHCFITTLNNLAGKEKWKDGEAHMHYISDKWRISREELIERIKSGDYPSTSVHIEFKTHRNS